MTGEPMAGGRLLRQRHRRRAGRGWTALAMLVAVGLAGCRREQATGASATTPAGAGSAAALATFPHAPVVVVSIDTLRSDHLPAYGYGGVQTPALDALRRDAVLFERAYSEVPLTLPSHCSLLSGLLPTQHGVRDNIGYRLAADPRGYLPLLLHERGYATAAAVSAHVLRGETGLRAGFDVYDDAIEVKGAVGLGAAQRTGDEAVAAAERWLPGVASRPFFLFVHLYEPHTPYEPPEPFASRYASAYDGEIAAADALVGQLIARLQALGRYDESLVVLLSDHGEGLGEHGEDEHGVLLYREDLQVPLMVKLPGGQRAGSSVREPVQLTDVAPTVAALLGFEASPAWRGRSLFAAPVAAPRPLFAETWYPRIHLGWSELTSVVEGDLHYVHGPEPELFDLARDGRETRNLLAERRRDVHRLRAAVEGFAVPLQEPEAVAPEEAAKLAALGYVTSRAAVSGPLPDPRRRVGALGDLRRAQGLVAARRDAEALPVLERLSAQEPQMEEAWSALGLALVHLDRLPAALAAYQRALQAGGSANPHLVVRVASLLAALGRSGDAVTLLAGARQAGTRSSELDRQLALTLVADGRGTEAEAMLEPLVRAGDQAAMTAMGQVLYEAGKPRRAEAVLRQALAAKPDDAKALETLGSVALQAGDAAQAREILERALRYDASLANAWNGLGVARQLLGDSAGALAAWQEAARLDSRQFDALFNAGLVAASTGRRELALQVLRRYVATVPRGRDPAEVARARQLLASLGAG